MWAKFISLVFFVVFTVTAALSPAQAAVDTPVWKEGTHYFVKDLPLTAKKEIREFFSFWCGHCFAMQPFFRELKKDNPDADFVHNPVRMLGGTMGPATQRAYVIAANAGLGDVFVSELFNDMHVNRNIPVSYEDLAVFMTKVGIPRKTFDNEYRSFPVIGAVGQLDSVTDRAEIEAVPEILVNGRYLVNTEELNSEQEMKDLVKYLLHKDNMPEVK